jgi:hypothetical protein
VPGPSKASSPQSLTLTPPDSEVPNTSQSAGASTLPKIEIAPNSQLPSTIPTFNGVDESIERVYEEYLYDLSGLDDNLNQNWLAPLVKVTTNRLAEATVRQASTLINAHEHGVGQLRDDQLDIKMTGIDTAALADCQDEMDFYVVSDTTNQPDPSFTRADFVGAAQLVDISGQWYVDVFTTTHTECNF